MAFHIMTATELEEQIFGVCEFFEIISRLIICELWLVVRTAEIESQFRILVQYEEHTKVLISSILDF